MNINIEATTILPPCTTETDLNNIAKNLSKQTGRNAQIKSNDDGVKLLSIDGESLIRITFFALSDK